MTSKYSGQQPADLEAVDARQCQGERIERTPFRVGGPAKTVTRCEKDTYFLAVENKPGKDGVRGAMGLCLGCAEIMSAQTPPNFFTLYLLVGGAKRK